MKPLVVASSAPGWAEGRRRKADAIAGTWRPDPEAFGDFAHALASRYSGETRDGGGALLPRVRHFQAWNEPNLGSFLMPQLRGPAREQVSAPIYRGLLNSFYSAVKSVHRGNLVVTAGLAPFGDHPARGWFSSTAPIAFTRALLCVGSTRRCPRVRFDAYAMQAFPARDPRQGPLNRDDVNLSVAGLRRVLQLAAGRGTISHRQARQIWMTELAWDGGPSARSRRVQANYLQLSLYILWREGVDAVLWYNVRDRAKRVFTWHSGLFTHGTTVAADRPKPALRAFRFPFVPTARGGHVLAWGRAPASGEPVVVEASAGGGRWRRLGSFPVRPDGVFARSVRAPAHGVLRARQGSATSLSSSVTTIAP
jgi:hypothetical protein